MTRKHLGRQSVRFDFPPSILSYASVVGKKEGEGPLAAYFDTISSDTRFGQQTWEKAEESDADAGLAGRFCARRTLSPSRWCSMPLCRGSSETSASAPALPPEELDIPFYGLYGEALLHHGTNSFSCRHGRRGRLCGDRSSCNLLPFRIRQSAKPPAPAGIWRSAYPHSAMDRHRLRSHPGRSRSGSALTSCGVTTGKICGSPHARDAQDMGAAMAPAFVGTATAHFADTGPHSLGITT